MLPPPPRSTLFPYTTLFRSLHNHLSQSLPTGMITIKYHGRCHIDRKSTRLNSSHVKTSYAVFCLKKKRRELPHTLISRTSSHLRFLSIIRHCWTPRHA